MVINHVTISSGALLIFLQRRVIRGYLATNNVVIINNLTSLEKTGVDNVSVGIYNLVLFLPWGLWLIVPVCLVGFLSGRLAWSVVLPWLIVLVFWFLGVLLVYLYECMCVFRHSFRPENAVSFLERVGTSAANGSGDKSSWGSVMKHRVIGVVQFVYPIKKKRRGLYVLFYFAANGAMIADLKQKLVYEDDVLRSLLLRVDEVPERVPTITGVEIQQQNAA